MSDLSRLTVTRYIIRRLLWGVALLVIVSALTFVLFRVLPTGDPAVLRAGRLQSPKIIAAIRIDLGLDKLAVRRSSGST